MDITKSHLIHHQKMAGVQNQSPNPTSLRTKTRTGSWIREAAQRPMTTLEELQKFTNHIGESVDRTTTGQALHQSDNYDRVALMRETLNHTPFQITPTLAFISDFKCTGKPLLSRKIS